MPNKRRPVHQSIEDIIMHHTKGMDIQHISEEFGGFLLFCAYYAENDFVPSETAELLSVFSEKDFDAIKIAISLFSVSALFVLRQTALSLLGDKFNMEATKLEAVGSKYTNLRNTARMMHELASTMKKGELESMDETPATIMMQAVILHARVAELVVSDEYFAAFVTKGRVIRKGLFN